MDEQLTKRKHIGLWLAAMILAALAPIAGWLAWQVNGELAAQKAQLAGELQRAAKDFAQSVNRELGSSVDALTVLSQSELFQQGRITAMGRLLHGRPRRDWESIFVLDPQGDVVLDTAQRPALPQSLHDLHAATMRKLAPVVSSSAGRQPGISIAMPIMQGDQVRYVLGVRLSDSVWAPLATNATVPAGGQARLEDAQGHLISQSGEIAAGPVYSGADTVAASGWRARVAVPAAPIDAARWQVVMRALSTSGVALLAGLVLAALLARAMARRL